MGFGVWGGAATAEPESHSDVEGGGCREGEGSEKTGGTNGKVPPNPIQVYSGGSHRKTINSLELLQK